MGYNPKLLKEIIEESGIKLKFLALKLGLSPYGLNRKIEGYTEFKNSEIIVLCETLQIANCIRDKIFFDSIVEK